MSKLGQFVLAFSLATSGAIGQEKPPEIPGVRVSSSSVQNDVSRVISCNVKPQEVYPKYYEVIYAMQPVDLEKAIVTCANTSEGNSLKHILEEFQTARYLSGNALRERQSELKKKSESNPDDTDTKNRLRVVGFIIRMSYKLPQIITIEPLL